MSLLLDEDYEIIKDAGLTYEEDEARRFLVITNYPAPAGLYISGDQPVTKLEVLVIIPPNYNISGTDMLWTHPAITRADGGPMPAVMGYGGGDPRHHKGKEFCRWSRHYQGNSWKCKVDNVLKILTRIEWALQNPAAT